MKQPDKDLSEFYKPKADWKVIGQEYRTGQGSISEIARRHGVSAQRIGQVAKRDGWVYGSHLPEIKENALKDAALDDAPVNFADDEEQERYAIRNASHQAGEAVKTHRRDLKKMRELADRGIALTKELLTKPAEEWSDNARTMLGKTQGTADVIDKLGSAFQKIITLERQSHGLDSDARKDDPNAFRETVEAAKRELARRGINVRADNGRVVGDSPTRPGTH